MIIGLAGKAQTGKDTVAKYIASKYGFVRYAFADPIKDMCNDLLGWDDRHGFGHLKEVIDPEWGFSPRQTYQICGTEFGRALNPDIWVMVAKKRLATGNNWIIPDVRFENESTFIRKYGLVIHIVREDAIKVNNHVSESGIDIKLHDEVITNNDTIEDLYSSIDYMMTKTVDTNHLKWR